jgi:hypothetical protein
MGHVVKTNGDYSIKTGEGATIVLDTGQGVGTTRVTGNLIVDGDTMTVSAENLNVQDNIIIVNFGETGAGVTLQYSGLEVDRGTLARSAFVFNEADDSWNIGIVGGPTSYSFTNSKLRVRTILTNSDTDDGDLTLIGTGTGVVKVTGTLNYENQVVDDDDVPNKKYVDDAILFNPSRSINQLDTSVFIADADSPGTSTWIGATPFESEIAVIVDGIPNSFFYSNRAKIQDIEFQRSEISNTDTNANLFLRTNGTGKVQTNYAVQFDQIAVTPASVLGASLIYGTTPGPGTTGLKFINSSYNDELASKNRALLFSMLF